MPAPHIRQDDRSTASWRPDQPVPGHRDRSSALRRLQRTSARLNRGFVSANAVGLVLVVTLACGAGDLMSRRVVGRMTLGMVLLLAEVASLLWTAAVFDRKSARQLDAPAHLLTHSRSDRERPLPAATDLWTPAERQRHHRSGATVAGSRR